MSKFSCRGSILLIVLLFCMLLGLLLQAIMGTALLQFKMVTNYQATIRLQQMTETRLLHLENKLATEFSLPDSAQIHFTQFVPDTLLFGEPLGCDFYNIKVITKTAETASFAIQTSYAIRHE